MIHGVDLATQIANEPNISEQDTVPEWYQSLLSFGIQNSVANRTRYHRRYNVIRHKEGVSYTQVNISASTATKLRKRYREEGFKVDLIEMGCE